MNETHPSKKTIIYSAAAPAPVGPYSQAVQAGGWLFVAGQIPLDPDTGVIVGADDIGMQTEQVMANLGAILTAAGTDWSQVVKTTVFLANLDDFAAMNQVYARYFSEATAPARACVEVSRLPKGVKVEIDCIALTGPSL
ncbi:RidA family protein [Candidatus Synechococcus calcipolaris G9]|uniref:RidA family protein n=1 Tax=Candidatus Synechococcus calcipolaris G9 TaxID=1497997 RepID=A0ABT6EWB0_9SYNE|nr:RidA family protein [Candidatus Synechococcus calcipolaris]MDG2990045.1 RidA family protein [Candidatus Synechococcus calcipolaris G9]